jgi:hypothetical protein
MNQAELHKKLIAAARSRGIDDRVPLAFEKRIMARLKSCAPRDWWGMWAPGLGRAAASCVALTLVLTAWSWLAPANSHTDLSQDLENTLLAVTDQDPSPDLTR